MHCNDGSTGSKLDESSGENCQGVVGSECFVNEGNLLPSSMVNAHNSLDNTASEGSNLVNSCHDTLSENAESKETIRCSGVSDDSGAVAMTSKTSRSRSRMKQKVSASSNVLDQSSNCIESQEEILSDDLPKKLNPGYPINKMGNKDSPTGLTMVSDPILGESRKDEVKLQSLHKPSSNHEDRVNSEKGNLEEQSGPEGNKERPESSVARSTGLGENRKDNKSSKSSSSNKSDEPISSPVSESESNDSEMVEHDVKVCDICGDAGREDLLAICSGCSDGAEHTYCMAERLSELPEGDWLCEECAEGAEKQKQEAKIERETEVKLNTHTGKRLADKIETASDAKRHAVESSTGSPKKSILPSISAFCRETSFKGLDRLRGKPNHQTSFSDDDTESARSTGSKLQPPKVAFLKSNSFNGSSLRPKGQLVDDAIHPRQKTGREYSALDLKDETFRNVGRSMSNRITDAGSSGRNESQTKRLGSQVNNVQEGKKSKQVKDRSTEANPSASSVNQKLKSRGISSTSHVNNNRDLKGLQSDGKRGGLMKQASNLNRNRLENAVALGGDISTNEKCSTSEQSSAQAEHKDELPSQGSVALQDGLLRSRESRELGKKSKEALSKRQRSSLLSGPKGLPSSQKGGPTAESSDISGVSDSDLSTTKTVREDINKGNRLRAAVDAALRKNPSFGKHRGLAQSDPSLVSNVDPSSDKTLQNQLPSKMHKNYAPPEGLQGGHPTSWFASDPYKQKIIANDKQLVPSAAVTIPPRSMEHEVIIPSAKPVMRDLPLVPAPVILRSSAIPDYESIWQGDLEVRKIRNEATIHSGMQAHLSTLASPRVAEVVNKFPERLSMNEVPRLSTWPVDFTKLGTKEDHIALFFFAKDIESYERNYKPLVDNMMKNDLALKGNLDNIELLIFASNQLPSNCQRWNMLYFLWGVFRGRKEICTNPQKNVSLPTSNVLPCDRDLNEPCQTSFPSKHLEKASYVDESLRNRTETRNGIDTLSHENPSNRESSIEQSPSTKEEIALKVEETCVNHIPQQATGSNSGDSLVSKVQQIEEQKLNGKKDLPLTVMDSVIHGQDKDLNCSQASDRKRPHWELTRPDNENSSAINQKPEFNNYSLSEGSSNKKMKTENGSSSLSLDNNSGIMKKSPKVVFPLDLNVERDESEVDYNLIPLGNDSNHERRLISGTVPDLELALGAEETTEEKNTKGLLPFLGGSRNTGEQSRNSMNKEKEKADEEEDDDEASLSLSLSFPGNEEKKTKKNVNTPLFLFRDLP